MADLFSNPNDLALASLGLRLMSTPGKFGPAIGTAGLGALNDLQQAQQITRQRKLQDELLAERQEELRRRRAAEDEAKLRATQTDAAWRGAFRSPDVGGEGPPEPPRFNQQALIDSLMTIPGGAEIAARMSMPKDPKLTTVGKGGTVIDDKGRVVFASPAGAEEDDKDVALLKLVHGDGTPAYFAALKQLAQKKTTHAPAASVVTYGSPQPFQLPDGSTGYIQPGNREGAAPQVMALNGTPVKAPPKPATPAEEKAAAAGRQSQQLLSAVQSARTLLTGKTKPTASGVGAAADATARMFGVSPQSAQVASQLETLSGWMVANVPRMEGPQSNFDVQNYQTMAAKVGDRTVPIPERLAALDTLESLQRKYASINKTAVPAEDGEQQRVRKFNPATGRIE